jgi:hypothetical protein
MVGRAGLEPATICGLSVRLRLSGRYPNQARRPAQSYGQCGAQGNKGYRIRYHGLEGYPPVRKLEICRR